MTTTFTTTTTPGTIFTDDYGDLLWNCDDIITDVDVSDTHTSRDAATAWFDRKVRDAIDNTLNVICDGRGSVEAIAERVFEYAEDTTTKAVRHGDLWITNPNADWEAEFQAKQAAEEIAEDEARGRYLNSLYRWN